MPRFKLTLEYDGSPFVGWQRQDNGMTVQQRLEEAALAFSGDDVLMYGAGRTDTGVHATGQVAHVDFTKDWEPDRVRDALNFHLKPDPIAVIRAEAVTEAFHARFEATGRTYLYRILNRRAPVALDRGRVWWVPVALDHQAMDKAAKHLLGNHDFTSFRAVHCQAKSPVKTLDRLDVTRVGDEVHLHLAARSFLHHQVRNFAGTLRLVGEGKWSADDLKAALQARDRQAAGPTAPADGLYLTSVLYEAEPSHDPKTEDP